MNDSWVLIHVDDDELFQDLVKDLLEDEIRELTFIQVTSLSEFQQKLQSLRNVAMVILDGNFFDVPNWRISFNLPHAIVLARSSWVPNIIAYSSDADAIGSIPVWQGPDEFILKWAQSANLIKVVNKTFSQAIV